MTGARHLRRLQNRTIDRLRSAMRDAGPTACVVVRTVKTGRRSYYTPFLGGAQLSALFGSTDEAENHAHELQMTLTELRGQRERACMCCARKFMSAGHHNRLCDTCRHLS